MVTVTALDSRTESMSVLVDGQASSTISISPDGDTVVYERQP